MPSFVNTPELEKCYHESQLPYTHVFSVCKKLQTITGIPIPEQQVEAWYRLFLLDRWTRKRFNEQAKAVSQTKIYGAISYANWLEGIEMIPASDVDAIMYDRLADYTAVLEGKKKTLKTPYDAKFHETAVLQMAVRQLESELRERTNRQFEQTVEQKKEELRKEAEAVTTEQLKERFPEVPLNILEQYKSDYAKIYITKNYEVEQ